MDKTGLIQEALVDLATTREHVRALERISRILADLSVALAGISSPTERSREVFGAVRGVVPFDAAAIVEARAQGGPRCLYGIDLELAEATARLAGEDQLLKEDEPTLVSDWARASEIVSAERPESTPRSLLWVPAPSADDPDVLLVSFVPGAFTAQSVALLRPFVRVLAAAILHEAVGVEPPRPAATPIPTLRIRADGTVLLEGPLAAPLAEGLGLHASATIPEELLRLESDDAPGFDGRLERTVEGRTFELRAGPRQNGDAHAFLAFDVTERRAHERQTHLAHRRIVEVVRALPAAVLIVGPDGRALMVNDTYARAFDVPSAPRDLAALSERAIANREAARARDPARYLAMREELARELQRGTRRCARTYIDRDGARVKLEIVPLQLRAKNSSTMWHFSRVEEEVRALETAAAPVGDLSELLDTLHDELLVFDERGMLLYANVPARRVLDLRPGALSMDDARQLAEDPETFDATIQATAADEAGTTSVRLRSPHAQASAPWRLTRISGEDGRPRVLATLQRATSRDPEISQTLALIAEKTGVGIALLDGQGTPQWANEAFAKLMGRPLDLVVRLSLPDVLHDVGQESALQLAAAIQGRRQIRSEIQWTYKSRESRWLSIDVSPVTEHDDARARLVLIATDITDRKTAELDMSEARSAAEFASKSKSDFLAMMSHEIRTPLNAIIGLTELSLQGSLPPEQRSLLRSVQANSEALTAILRDVLDFSRIEAQQTKVMPRPFSLVDLVESVADALSIHAEAKDLELSCFCDPRIASTLQGDPDLLRQVLMNLVGNAIKFTDAGDIAITADLVSSRPGHASVVFSVVDTGVGIPAHQRDLIFEQFVQADRSTSRQFGGTGLGLCISKSLVELMGGSITVDSEMGCGSTFTIEIEFPTLAEEDGLSNIPSRFVGLRVLVCDHNARSANSVSRLLSAWGAEVRTSSAVQDVTNAIEGHEDVDLLIVDLSMHRAHRMKTGRRRSTPAPTPACHVLILCRNSELDPRLLAEGGQHHLTKPARQESLRLTMAQSLKLDHLSTGGEQKTPSSETTERPDQEFKGLEVLLIEDNFDNRRLAMAMLGKQGMVVTAFESGVEALDAFESRLFDIVLTDLEMPGMDGVEVARRIRALESEKGLSRTPIVAVTAHALVTFQDSCREAGMDGFLTKPVRWPEMFGLLSEMLNSRPRVLVVDDSLDVRTLVTKALATIEVEIETCEGGAAAIQRVSKTHFDLVLLDMLMPGMDGTEALRRIKEVRPNLKVVSMTALARRELEKKTRSFDGMITKPIERAELIDMVQRFTASASKPSATQSASSLRREASEISPEATPEDRPPTRGTAGPPTAVIDPDIMNLIPSFMESRRQDVGKLRTCLSSGDLETARRIGHTLKGVGASYGFPEITHLGQAIERAVIDGRTDQAHMKITALDEFLSSVVIQPAGTD